MSSILKSFNGVYPEEFWLVFSHDIKNERDMLLDAFQSAGYQTIDQYALPGASLELIKKVLDK